MLEELVTWFEQVREPHFFRQHRTPYRVWVAEVALQQTRIQAALAPLRRFFTAFPTLNELAKASEQEVLYAFRGLGYYSRARNLRKGAIYIAKHHGGKLPDDYQQLLKIPSIGPYTAAAIASICFGQPYPVCDGNVKRVLARLHQWSDPVSSKNLENKSYQFLQKLFANMQLAPGEVNEALMELGQKVCVRSQPQCQACPVQGHCQAFANKTTSDYPVKAKKKPAIPVTWHLYIVHNRVGEVLLQKWQDFYFLKGQTSFPSILEFPKEEMMRCSWSSSPPSLQRLHKQAELLPTVRHSITKHQVTIFPYSIAAKKIVKFWQGQSQFFWVKPQQVSSYLVASALTKVWQSKSCQGIINFEKD